jgi:recombinational DNA repair protein RecR
MDLARCRNCNAFFDASTHSVCPFCFDPDNRNKEADCCKKREESKNIESLKLFDLE